MKKLNIAILILFCSITTLSICCKGTKKLEVQTEPGKKIRYFTSFSGYDIPSTPTDEISEKDALPRENYYIVHYNDIGQITVFKTIVNKNFFSSGEYEYYDNGKIKREKITKPDGTVRIVNFDQKGRAIRNK
jgi:hypothetical protein